MGISFVRLYAAAVWARHPAALRQLVIKKNGQFFPGGAACNRLANHLTTADLQAVSAIVSVVPGDYFEVQVYQMSGAKLPVLASTATWFGIEVR